MEFIIQLEGVSKYYKEIKALNNVNLELPPGAVGLLGPNGAGKSTLVKVLLGLVTLNQGRGKVLGFDVVYQSRQVRERVGYLSEDDCYIAGFTGVESVMYSGQLAGIPRRESLRRSHEILDYVGVGEERYREVQTYSTGMKQKIKFAQALIHDPELLLLDEPTSGLDPEGREKMLRNIKNLATKKGISVLLSTHLLADVEKVCDYIVILSRGTVITSDRLDVLQKPTSNAYIIRFHGDGESLVSEFSSNGYSCELLTADSVRVVCDHPDIGNFALMIARTRGVQIREILPARNTLEEIFLKALTDANL